MPKHTFEIHYTLPNGGEDYVTISGYTLEEVRDEADAAVEKRGGRDPWSRDLT